MRAPSRAGPDHEGTRPGGQPLRDGSGLWACLPEADLAVREDGPADGLGLRAPGGRLVQPEVSPPARRARPILEEPGTPPTRGSRHTATVDDYVIEGHAPVGAITQLLDLRPDAIGLTLPGMPLDSPGMGGDETTWESQPVMLINHDGSLTPFSY